MNSPQEVRDFLQWYHGDGEALDTSSELPDWLAGRVSSLDTQRTGRSIVPIEKYDLKTRLREESGAESLLRGASEEDLEWRAPESNRDEIEREWRESVEQEGLEAFAWYVPFHFSSDRWGIYVDEVGIQVLGHLLYEWSRDLEGPSQTGSRMEWSPGDPLTTPIQGAKNQGEPAFENRFNAFSLVLEILLRHEWYHHQVELLASHLEDASDSLHYEAYHKDVYRETFADEPCIEESLANAYVYRSRASRNRAPTRDVFRALFDKSTTHQPTAYENYDRYLDSDFRSGGQYLGYLIRSGDSGAAPLEITDTSRRLALGANLPFTTAVHQPRNHRHVPIYIVRPPYRLPHLNAFRAIQLETDYEIVRSERWVEKYRRTDSSLQALVDKTENKLARNVNLPGFQWRTCPGGNQYGRMNEQYRFVVERDDQAQKIELLAFGGHDLPKTEFNCY